VSYRTSPPRDEDLRDRFAMAALSGLLADSTIQSRPDETLDGMRARLAICAYGYADAMLRERDR
jgi:hypothetical protein